MEAVQSKSWASLNAIVESIRPNIYFEDKVLHFHFHFALFTAAHRAVSESLQTTFIQITGNHDNLLPNQLQGGFQCTQQTPTNWSWVIPASVTGA